MIRYQDYQRIINKLDKSKFYLVYFEDKSKFKIFSQIIRLGAYIKYKNHSELRAINLEDGKCKWIKSYVNHVGFICKHDNEEDIFLDTVIAESISDGFVTNRLWDRVRKFKGRIIFEEFPNYNQKKIDSFVNKNRSKKYNFWSAVASWFNVSRLIKKSKINFCSYIATKMLSILKVKIDREKGRPEEITPSNSLYTNKYRMADKLKIKTNLFYLDVNV